MSALFETIRDRNLVKVSPALENTRSEGAEVAGTQRILLANLDTCGNRFSF